VNIEFFPIKAVCVNKSVQYPDVCLPVSIHATGGQTLEQDCH
jgi:hypothetical protein